MRAFGLSLLTGNSWYCYGSLRFSQKRQWTSVTNGYHIAQGMLLIHVCYLQMMHIIWYAACKGVVMDYLYTTHSKCYASWESSQFDNKQGYPCQRLRIMEDCTVFWVPYTAGHPIHPRSVIGGHMANGDVVYVTKFDYSYPPVVSLAGHYVKGTDRTISPAGGALQSSTTMMMLIVL